MIVREAFDYEFSRLDPTGAHIDPPSVALYETLLVKGPDWQPHPMLADSWEISDDRLTWRMRLRPGLRFHSGARCDAQAVFAALDYLRWHLQGERQLWYWDPVDTFHVEDDRTLVFKLHYPYARLPSLLWGTHTGIYNEAARSSQPDAFGYTTADGAGPYQLVSWSLERVMVERWAAYPGVKAPFIECDGAAQGIEWISIPDEHERLAALERGDVHCLHGPPLDQVDDLLHDDRFTVIEYVQGSNFYLALNWRWSRLGFDDLRVRRALSLGIDRAKLVAAAVSGRGRPTLGPLSPGDEYYDPSVDSASGYDPAQAARLLDTADWVVADDGVRARGGQRLSFECVCQDDSVHRRVAYAVREQLAALGVQLELRFAKPFEAFYDAVSANPASFINKWLWQDSLDAAIGFSASHCRPFPNWQGADIPALDSAYEAWLRAGSRAELQAASGQAQHIAAEQLPYIPLLTPNDVWVHAKRLRGWRPFQANLYPFYHGVRVEA